MEIFILFSGGDIVICPNRTWKKNNKNCTTRTLLYLHWKFV